MEDLQQEHKSIELSVVVPVYNAAKHIAQTVNNVVASCDKLAISYEIILVDDGSRDESWNVLQKIKSGHKHISIIQLTRNFGQHNATICGLKHASGKYALTIDDDLEDDPELIGQLLAEIQKTKLDLVYGMNKSKKKSFGRSVLTAIYKKISKLEGIDKGKGSSYRIMTKALANSIAKSSTQFLFIDEICLWYTSKIGYIYYQAKGSKIKSRYRKKDLFGLAGNVIMFSSTLPLRLVTLIGFTMASVNFIIGVYFIFRKFVHDVPAGYTSTLISILFGTGLILMALGIIGEYVGKMLKLLHNAPVYEIREKE